MEKIIIQIAEASGEDPRTINNLRKICYGDLDPCLVCPGEDRDELTRIYLDQYYELLLKIFHEKQGRIHDARARGLEVSGCDSEKLEEIRLECLKITLLRAVARDKISQVLRKEMEKKRKKERAAKEKFFSKLSTDQMEALEAALRRAMEKSAKI